MRVAGRSAVGAAVVLLVLCATVALALTPSQRQLRHNKAAARADATALVNAVNLPAGTARSTTEPSGDHGYLKPQGALESDRAHRLAHAWWTSSESPSALLAYLKAHPPHGTKLDMTGYIGTKQGIVVQIDGFDARPIHGVLGSRTVEVSVTTLADGQTGVLAQAQSDYIVPRPSSEKIPHGVHELDVTVQRVGTTGKRKTVYDQTFTARHRIHAAVKLIDSLGIVQPVTTSCPAVFDTVDHIVTVRFRHAAGRPPLAAAQFFDQGSPPWGVGTQCNPIGFSIRGHRRGQLVGHGVQHHLARLLGITFPR